MKDSLKKPYSGCFIALEGMAGTNEPAQFELLVKRLISEGYSVERFSFPQYNSMSGYFVSEYLKGKYGSQDEVGPYTASTFYSLDKFQVADKIRKLLDSGYVVVAEYSNGSNMALQAKTINELSSRHGFYLWLEAIEYKMLDIPRPDISLVLTVPEMVLTENLDLVDDTIGSIESKNSIRIYNELCEVFPNEYRLLDCTRDNVIMSKENISKHVWETIRPYLPNKASSKQKISDERSLSDSNTSECRTQDQHKTTENFKDEEIKYWVPDTLDAKTSAIFQTKIDQILELRATIKSELMKYLKKRDSFEYNKSSHDMVLSICNKLLPLITLNGTSPENTKDIFQFTNDKLFKNTSKTQSKYAKPNTVSQLAEKYLPRSYSITAIQPAATLVAVTPKNELDLVPEILFKYSEDSLKSIRDVVAIWSYDKKSEVLISYLKNIASQGSPNDNSLDNIRYTWDIFCDYETFENLSRILKNDISTQTLTPRHGFDIPKFIEEAGLTELFEKCFELSLGLYSDLQAQGYEVEAQLATLFGHKIRCKAVIRGSKLQSLFSSESNTGPSYTDILTNMHEKISATHPILSTHLDLGNSDIKNQLQGYK